MYLLYLVDLCGGFEACKQLIIKGGFAKLSAIYFLLLK